MAKSKKEIYVHTKRKQPVFAVVKFILRLFIHKPKIISYNDKIPTDGIIIAPHHGKWGPLFLCIHYPKKISCIGAHPMLGSYKERFHYLRDVLYIQKLHRKKFGATLAAGFEAIFSKMIYKGMHLIPSYDDYRFLNTINYACKTIENGLPVVVFPENSDQGYDDIMHDFHPGFVKLIQFYNRRYKCDVPVYPLYEHLKKKLIVINKPFYLSELQGMSEEEICRYAEDRINKLYFEHIKDKN